MPDDPDPGQRVYTEADLARLRGGWEADRERERLTAEAGAATSAIADLRRQVLRKLDRSEVTELIDDRLHHHGVISRTWFSGIGGKAVALGGTGLLLLTLWTAIGKPLVDTLTHR